MSKSLVKSPIYIIESGTAPTTETLPAGCIAIGTVGGYPMLYFNDGTTIQTSGITFTDSKLIAFPIFYVAKGGSVDLKTKEFDPKTGKFSVVTSTFPIATSSGAGTMSATDKAKLDAYPSYYSIRSQLATIPFHITLRKERIYNTEYLDSVGWYEQVSDAVASDAERPLIPNNGYRTKFYIDGCSDWEEYHLAMFVESSTIQRYRREGKSLHKRRRSLKLIAHGTPDAVFAMLANEQDIIFTGLVPESENKYISILNKKICAFNKNQYPRKLEAKAYIAVLPADLFLNPDNDMPLPGNYKMVWSEADRWKPAQITLADAVSNAIEVTVRYSTCLDGSGNVCWKGNVLF